MDNRGNSRANTCAKTRLLGRAVFISCKTNLNLALDAVVEVLEEDFLALIIIIIIIIMPRLLTIHHYHRHQYHYHDNNNNNTDHCHCYYHYITSQ